MQNIKSHFAKNNIEIRPSPIHRYGVFATKNILPNEIIEECPIIIIQSPIVQNQEEIKNRVYFWDKTDVAFALGYGSLYNHSDHPNANFLFKHQEEIIKFIAIKPINTGDEILINYDSDDWFVANNSQKLALQEEKRSNRSITKIFILLFSLLMLSILFPVHSA